MDFSLYQKQAHRTSKAGEHQLQELVPILGLAGEAGELLNEYKKKLRDGDAHLRFRERLQEELGDVLWYLAEIATQFDLDLSEIAAMNLAKARARWCQGEVESSLFDAVRPRFDGKFPTGEQLPRQFTARFVESPKESSPRIQVFIGENKLGDDLTDNCHQNDGYRFHDIFHLATAATLGWSPVTRRNLKRKRRSDPLVDEVEDGGRAIVTEEGISQLVFGYASEHGGLRGIERVDYDLLKAIRLMTRQFEVRVCTAGEWEKAILMAYRVWKDIQLHGGGEVAVDLDQRNIKYVLSPKDVRSAVELVIEPLQENNGGPA